MSTVTRYSSSFQDRGSFHSTVPESSHVVSGTALLSLAGWPAPRPCNPPSFGTGTCRLERAMSEQRGQLHSHTVRHFLGRGRTA